MDLGSRGVEYPSCKWDIVRTHDMRINVHAWTWPERKIMKWTTLTFKELAAQKTLRMDAKYWIKKKAQASSRKHQATSLPQSGDTVITKKGK